MRGQPQPGLFPQDDASPATAVPSPSSTLHPSIAEIEGAQASRRGDVSLLFVEPIASATAASASSAPLTRRTSASASQTRALTPSVSLCSASSTARCASVAASRKLAAMRCHTRPAAEARGRARACVRLLRRFAAVGEAVARLPPTFPRRNTSVRADTRRASHASRARAVRDRGTSATSQSAPARRLPDPRAALRSATASRNTQGWSD